VRRQFSRGVEETNPGGSGAQRTKSKNSECLTGITQFGRGSKDTMKPVARAETYKGLKVSLCAEDEDRCRKSGGLDVPTLRKGCRLLNGNMEVPPKKTSKKSLNRTSNVTSESHRLRKPRKSISGEKKGPPMKITLLDREAGRKVSPSWTARGKSGDRETVIQQAAAS